MNFDLLFFNERIFYFIFFPHLGTSDDIFVVTSCNPASGLSALDVGAAEDCFAL